MNKYIIFLIFFVCNLAVFSQENITPKEYKKIVEPVEDIENYISQEVIYVQTDKDIYENGEEIWFNATIFQSRNNQLFSNSKIVYFNLLNQERKKIQSAKYAVNESSSSGNFYVSDTIAPGKYYLTAYTKNSINNILNSYNSIKEIEIRKNIIPKIIISNQVNISEDDIIKVKIKLFFRDGNKANDASVKLQAINKKKSKIVGKSITDSNGYAELFIDKDKIVEFEKFNLIVKSKENLVETKSIKLLDISNKMNVEFYPEGGNLLEGINQKIGINIKNRVNENLNSKAFIIRNSKIVDSIKIDKNGIGVLNFKPLKFEKYFLKIDNKYFEFPEPNNKSTILRLVSQDKSNYKFEIINKNENLQNKQIFIKAQAKGIVFWLAKVKLNKERIIFNISKDILPINIIEISLSDVDEGLISTRYVFSNFEKKLYCKLLDFEDKKINNKSKVKLKIQILDKDKNPVYAKANITVFDNQFKIDSFERSMQSFLKIENDLVPKLNYPTEYFNNNEIDNLMLTLDNKSYRWSQSIKNGKFHKVNINEDINGSVYKKNESGYFENSKKTEIYINTPKNILFTETDDNGFFSIDVKLLEQFQNERLILTTSNENLFINLLKDKEDDIDLFYNTYLFNRLDETSLNDTIKIKKKIKNFSFNSVNVLEEIVLLTKLSAKPKHKESLFEYFGENNDHVCFQFNVLNCKNHKIGYKPRHGEMYYVVDENSIFSPILKKYVDPLVLEEEAKLAKRRIKNFAIIENLMLRKNFPNPNYEKDTESLEIPDYRKTLFWSNNMKTNKDGIIEIEFFTSDISGLFRGEIDVFDENGNFASLIINLSVK